MRRLFTLRCTPTKRRCRHHCVALIRPNFLSIFVKSFSSLPQSTGTDSRVNYVTYANHFLVKQDPINLCDPLKKIILTAYNKLGILRCAPPPRLSLYTRGIEYFDIYTYTKTVTNDNVKTRNRGHALSLEGGREGRTSRKSGKEGNKTKNIFYHTALSTAGVRAIN